MTPTRILSLVALITILSIGTAFPSTILDSGTWDANGHTYVLVEFDSDSDRLWDTARADVTPTLGAGFRLASITESNEDSFVQTLLADRGPEWWVGGFQDPITETDANGGWTWATGEPFAYTNWCEDEPNDAFVPGLEQHLVLSQNFPLFCWNDEGSAIGIVRGYIAETFEPTAVPEPSTLGLLGLGLTGLGLMRRRRLS